MKYQIVGLNNSKKTLENNLSENQIIKEVQSWNNFFYNLGSAADQVKEVNFLNGSIYCFMNYGQGFLE